MHFIRHLLQEAVIITVRPLIIREIWAWGKIYRIFVGGYKRNWFWRNAKRRQIKGKLNNYLMDLDISEWPDRSTFFLGRWYDLPTQKLLEEVLQIGDEVVDIGANVGMFSLAARSLIGDEGTVYSFEPNPEVQKRLYNNIEINQIKNVIIYPVGLGDSEGNFTLSVPHINSGEGTISKFRENEYEDAKCHKVQVDVKIGDDVLYEAAPRLIKIDVEGGEVGVLRGISKLISKCRPLIVAEYVPQHLARFDTTFDDILSIAKYHSYNIFALGLAKGSHGYQLSILPLDKSGASVSCDILLVHEEDPYIGRGSLKY